MMAWLTLIVIGLPLLYAFLRSKKLISPPNFSGWAVPAPGIPSLGGHFIKWLLISLGILAAAGLAIWGFSHFKTPGNLPEAAVGLPNIAINTQALYAAVAALVALLVLLYFFKALRELFSGWGSILALLLFVALAAMLFFFGPHLVALAQKAPDWVTETANDMGPGFKKVASTVLLLMVGIPILFALLGSKEDWKEKAFGSAALILVGYFLWFAIWEWDGSRQQYADTNYPSATSRSAETPSCPGNGETKTVGPDSWVTVNAEFKCHIIFEVVGTEMLLGEPSNYVTANPGDQVGNVLKKQGVRVISVKTTGGYGYLNYKLHPLGCRENGWECT